VAWLDAVVLLGVALVAKRCFALEIAQRCPKPPKAHKVVAQHCPNALGIVEEQLYFETVVVVH
jgi:hypothetical protein